MEFDPMNSTPATSDVAADFREWVPRNLVKAIDPSNAKVVRRFIPDRKLKHYLDKRRIQTLLHSCCCPQYEWEIIQLGYLAVFATLIFIGRGTYIQHFIRYDYLTDDRLPFLNEGDLPPECRPFFQEFSAARWQFCVVPLRRDRLTEKRLTDEQIVPIIGCETLKAGTDSSTYLVEIHPDYNQLAVDKDQDSLPTTNCFVLKVSPANNEQYHELEVKAYKTMIHHHQDGGLPNMAQFYGSWHQRERYNILLEYVEGGNLEEYYKAPPPTNAEDILKFWTRLLDVVKPVMLIHKLPCPKDNRIYIEGIHHDIKASNILVSYTGPSPYDATFKLADLGLSDFAFPPQRDREPRRRDKSGAQTYSAPECFRDERDHVSRRKIIEARPSKDVWSLGCLLSEAVAWAIWGKEGLEQYQKDRIAEIAGLSNLRNTAYMSCFHNGKGILKAVNRLHVRARKEHRRNDYVINEILPLIEKMLGAAESRPDANYIYKSTQEALRIARECCETDLSGTSETKYPGVFRKQPPELPPEEANGPTKTPSRRRHPEANPKAPATPSSSVSDLGDMGPSIPNASGRSRYFEEFHEETWRRGKKGRTNPGSSSRSIQFMSDPAPTLSQPQWNPGQPKRHSAIVNRPATKQKDDYQNTVVPPRSSGSHSRSPGSREKPPHVTIQNVEDWMNSKRRSGGTRPLDGHEYLSSRLDKRDQIFLIDNSSSMQPHWENVERTFMTLAYLVKRMDPDGMELYFTNADREKTARSKDRKKLLALFKSITTVGQSDIGFSLSKILRAYEGKHLREKDSFLSRFRKEKWGVSIYVLTDAVWEEGESWYHGMVELINTLLSKNIEPGQVGIEFIQFGNDKEGTRRLRTLDDGLLGHGVSRDMIDFEPWTGNAYKMLLGSVHPYWDNIDRYTSDTPSESITDKSFEGRIDKPAIETVRKESV